MSSSVFLYEPFYDFDRLFDEAYNARASNLAQRRTIDNNNTVDPVTRTFKPRMDLHENDEKNLVTATFELPGVQKEDVNIDVHNGRLTVTAQANQSVEHDKNGYAVRERRFGKFSRALQLPRDIKDEDIKASMEHGILTVTFPKSVPELAPKKITIS